MVGLPCLREVNKVESEEHQQDGPCFSRGRCSATLCPGRLPVALLYGLPPPPTTHLTLLSILDTCATKLVEKAREVAMEVLVGHLTMSGRRLAFLGVVHNYYQSRLSKPHPVPSFSLRKREEATLLVAQRIGRRGIQGRQWPCQPHFLPPARREGAAAVGCLVAAHSCVCVSWRPH